MFPKILLVVIFFAVLMLIPISKVNATQVYVGVQVTNATAPGCTPNTDGDWNCPGANPATDNNWCLPTGLESYQKTQMAVTTTGISSCWAIGYNYSANDLCSYCSPNCLSATSPSTNPVSATSPLCAGGSTIWSGLLNLTNGTGYQIYLYTPNFCPGYLNGYCWVSNTVNKNCCDVCSHYGLTAASSGSDCLTSTNCYTPYNTNYDDANCTTEAKLMGSACSPCTTGASYSYYNPATKACWTTYGPSSYIYAVSCSEIVNSSVARVCACNYASTARGFLFPFTASF